MVGIKDFKMPRCCNDCQTFDHSGDAGEDVYCALTGECLEEWRRKFVDIKNERGKQCPLIEI